MPPSMKERIVVAVDFGETYTCVAYAFSEDSKNLEVISDWPGCGNRTCDKVPTEILYLGTEPDGVRPGGFRPGGVRPGADGKRRYEWGYDINLESWRNAEPLKSFKRLLDDRKPRVANNTLVAQTAAKLRQLRLSAVEVSADYLRAVREHTISVLEIRFSAGFVRASKIEYVLTVPAAWSAPAISRFVEAVRNAGFGEYKTDFNLIAGPKAAATYALKAMPPNNILRVRDIFVVADAGKKTVDLASFKIQQLNPLVIDEVTAGSGGFFGSDYLDEQFERQVRNLLGNDTIDRMRRIAKLEMKRQWEEKVKFRFADAEEIEYYDVYIPGVPDNEMIGLEAGFLSLTRAELKKIFSPVIDRVVDPIDEEIRSVMMKGGKVSAILLVGSLSSSKYLCKCLAEQIFYGGKVKILRQENTWSDTARGALIQGLDGSFSKG